VFRACRIPFRRGPARCARTGPSAQSHTHHIPRHTHTHTHTHTRTYVHTYNHTAYRIPWPTILDVRARGTILLCVWLWYTCRGVECTVASKHLRRNARTAPSRTASEGAAAKRRPPEAQEDHRSFFPTHTGGGGRTRAAQAPTPFASKHLRRNARTYEGEKN
jgi:hypothetical protein